MLGEFRCLARTGRTKTRFGEKPLFDEGLYDLGAGVYAWMVPNGSWGETNCGLITAADRSMLVDTPWDVRCTHEMLDAMRPVTESHPVRTVVNTHSDGDHCWGNQFFANEEIIASNRAAQGMTHVSPASLRALGRLGRTLRKIPARRARHVGRWFEGMTAPYDFSAVRLTLPNRQFTGELSLTVGNRPVLLRELGPAHTDGDTIVYVPDAGVLFSGDLLFIESTPVVWAGPVENWLSALDAILAYDARVIVPGHGPLASRDSVLRVRNYLEFVSEAALNWYAEGLPPSEAARRIAISGRFAELGFEHWDSPERIMTTVHTIYRGAGYRPLLRGTAQTILVLGRQAELAFDMPEARPRHMHGAA